MKKNPLIKPGIVVVVIGLGVTGRAAVKYLQHQGALVYVSDARSFDELSSEEQKLLESCADFECGGHTEDFILRAEKIFVSPGVPQNLDVLQAARKQNIPILGELSLCGPVLDCKIIAITGTNGKTTVTTLIGEIIKRAGKKVFVGGNIGNPIIEYLLNDEEVEVAVLEISSFQLENAEGFSADIGLLLNITPDHIDRHGGEAGYILAKKKLFDNQRDNGFAVINHSSTICKEMVHLLYPKTVYDFGFVEECTGYICESVVRFRQDNTIEEYELQETKLDNGIGWQNSAAAIIATRLAGCSPEAVQSGLNEFIPLPHRIEFVVTVDGVDYVNDSKATNSGAVISALKHVKGKAVLIAGGKDKGENYRLLRDSVKEKVRKLILIGEAAQKMAEHLSGITDIQMATSMEEAVSLARSSAKAGDTVLLSPACASFDMFSSYGHRGECFKEAVFNLLTSAKDEVGVM